MFNYLFEIKAKLTPHLKMEGNDMPWMTDIYYNNATANDSRGAFGTRPLHMICIPGTHDSGCYIDHTINAFSKTQTKNIFDQLCGGIRYFDIRPYAKDANFFTFHGPVYTGDQIDGENGILSQIYNFLIMSLAQLIAQAGKA